MKLSNLMGLAAVISFVYGIAFILMPGLVLSFYGVTVNAAGTLMTQFFGTALLSIAIMNWLTININQTETLRAVVLANVIPNTVGFVVALLAQLVPVANALGWSVVLIYLFLALGFAYFLFKPVARTGQSPASVLKG